MLLQDIVILCFCLVFIGFCVRCHRASGWWVDLWFGRAMGVVAGMQAVVVLLGVIAK